MPFLTNAAKSVVAFALAVLMNMITDLIQGSKPWPQNGDEWIQYALTSFVVALGVYGVGNKLNQKQVTKGMEGLPVEQQEQVAKDALTRLPDPVSNKVVTGYPDWATG